MISFLEKEFTEFEKYHRNKFNLYFHIFCGIIYMAFLLSIKFNYSINLILYSLLILFTIDNILISFIISVVLFIIGFFIQKLNFSVIFNLVLFLIFYFLPDLSHYLSNEHPVLNVNNITLSTIFVNIFYLLPFSFKCLFDTK
jgi:hypothetical protein